MTRVAAGTEKILNAAGRSATSVLPSARGPGFAGSGAGLGQDRCADIAPVRALKTVLQRAGASEVR